MERHYYNLWYSTVILPYGLMWRNNSRRTATTLLWYTLEYSSIAINDSSIHALVIPSMMHWNVEPLFVLSILRALSALHVQSAHLFLLPTDMEGLLSVRYGCITRPPLLFFSPRYMYSCCTSVVLRGGRW